jgi:hypothetical protein
MFRCSDHIRVQSNIGIKYIESTLVTDALGILFQCMLNNFVIGIKYIESTLVTDALGVISVYAQ